MTPSHLQTLLEEGNTRLSAHLRLSLSGELQGGGKGSHIEVKLPVLPIEFTLAQTEEWCGRLAGQNSECFVEVVVIEPLGSVPKHHTVGLLSRYLDLTQVRHHIWMNQKMGGETSLPND